MPCTARDPHAIAELEVGWDAPRADEAVRVRCWLDAGYALAPWPVGLPVLTAQAAMSGPVAGDRKAAVCLTLDQPLLTEWAVLAWRAGTQATAEPGRYSGLREVAVAALHLRLRGGGRAAARALTPPLNGGKRRLGIGFFVMGFWAAVDCLRAILFHLCKAGWNRMTCRQKALFVSCCSLIVIILIFLWVRIGLMGCSCPKQFDICETYTNADGVEEGRHCECLCDGNFFTCEYTCPGCSGPHTWNQFTGEPYKLPQAGCCWGEDGSWGSDKEREGCSIQYCGQAPCDGQDVRDAKNTHWTQHPLYAMAALWWPVLLIACFCCCVCCCVCCAGGRGPTDAAPTLTAAPSPALGAQEVARAAVQQLSAAAEAEADPGSSPNPVLQGLNVLLGCATAAAAAAAAGLEQEEEGVARVVGGDVHAASDGGETVEEESEGEAEADPGSSPNPVLQGLNVLLSFFEEESEGGRPTRAPQHCDT